MLQNMAANVLDIMGAIENPNDRLAEIENIYANIEEQLEALSTELVPDSNQIEETIINFNRAVNNKDKEVIILIITSFSVITNLTKQVIKLV